MTDTGPSSTFPSAPGSSRPSIAPTSSAASSAPPSYSTSPADLSSLLARPPIRRARAQLSCTPCRTGKLKCNREHPVCDQCSKRGKEDACHYVPPPPKTKPAQSMRGRIRNLENLVVTLINQNPQVRLGGTAQSTQSPELGEGSQNDAATSEEGSPKEDDEPNVDSFGELRIGHKGTENYAGPGHWSTILKEIEEVKQSLDDDDSATENQQDEWDYLSARSSVTFGLPKPVNKSLLIQELQKIGKEAIDRLLPLWFNSADPLLFIVHQPTFLKEYNQFWSDPSSASVMWIAMLFSIMALGIIVGPGNPGILNPERPSGSQDTLQDRDDGVVRAVNRFQQLASSAMVLGDIAKAQPYTLETLMIYAECEFLRRDDHHTKAWLLNGVVMRVALRMGYHRDPSNFSGVSPFQAEMRRRVFHTLSMLDTTIAFVIGLPTSVRTLDSDVKPPRNLYDTDISPDMKELPEGRADTELTPALYNIAKLRITNILSEAVELIQRVVPPKHSDIMEVNRRLDEVYQSTPEVLRVRPLEEYDEESAVLILGRFNIELLYQKARIVLHRNYLIAGQTDSRFAESRRICLEASKVSLQHQMTIFHACQPGGRLNRAWWYMSALNTYDFLVAAMVLCLELYHLQKMDSSSPDIPGLIELLEDTRKIWSNNRNRYRESVRAAEILKTMIEKCSTNNQLPRDPQAVLNDSQQRFTQAHMEIENAPEYEPEDLPPPIWNTFYPTNEVAPVEQPDIPSIDWSGWDSTMQGHAHMLPQRNWAAPQADHPDDEQFMDITDDATIDVDAQLNNVPDTQFPFNLPGSTQCGSTQNYSWPNWFPK